MFTKAFCIGGFPSTTKNAPTDTCGGISLPKCAYIVPTFWVMMQKTVGDGRREEGRF